MTDKRTHFGGWGDKTRTNQGLSDVRLGFAPTLDDTRPDVLDEITQRPGFYTVPGEENAMGIPGLYDSAVGAWIADVSPLTPLTPEAKVTLLILASLQADANPAEPELSPKL